MAKYVVIFDLCETMALDKGSLLGQISKKTSNDLKSTKKTLPSTGTTYLLRLNH